MAWRHDRVGHTAWTYGRVLSRMHTGANFLKFCVNLHEYKDFIAWHMGVCETMCPTWPRTWAWEK